MTRYLIEKTIITTTRETYEVEAPSLDYAMISLAEQKPIGVEREVIHESTTPLITADLEGESR